MRALEDFELELVIGGGDVDEVVIVGDDDDDDDEDNDEGGFDEDGDDEDDDEDDEENGDGDDDPSNDDPFPPEIMQQIHEKVLAWSNQYKNSPVEYVALIYILNGQVFVSDARTINSPDSAPFLNPDEEIPEGGVVIGFIHNHPNEGDEPGDSYPSTGLVWGEDGDQIEGDWAYADWILGGALWDVYPEGQGFQGDTEIDANFLTYIVNSEGVYEFTIDDYQTMYEEDGEEVVPEEAAP